jgi:hypothetical protein
MPHLLNEFQIKIIYKPLKKLIMNHFIFSKHLLFNSSTAFACFNVFFVSFLFFATANLNAQSLPNDFVKTIYTDVIRHSDKHEQSAFEGVFTYVSYKDSVVVIDCMDKRLYKTLEECIYTNSSGIRTYHMRFDDLSHASFTFDDRGMIAFFYSEHNFLIKWIREKNQHYVAPKVVLP